MRCISIHSQFPSVFYIIHISTINDWIQSIHKVHNPLCIQKSLFYLERYLYVMASFFYDTQKEKVSARVSRTFNRGGSRKAVDSRCPDSEQSFLLLLSSRQQQLAATLSSVRSSQSSTTTKKHCKLVYRAKANFPIHRPLAPPRPVQMLEKSAGGRDSTTSERLEGGQTIIKPNIFMG